uniref:NADH dehydrogenase subunit 4L n=1 Tax=Tetraonchus monenteron TaxID=198446 RepID=UPI0014367439
LFSFLFCLLGLFIGILTLCCNRFYFLGFLILSENFNLLTLFFIISTLGSFSSGPMIFLCFLVVATIEITLALTLVSRLNCGDCWVF